MPGSYVSVHEDSVIREIVVVMDDVVEIGMMFSAVKIVAKDAPAVLN